MAPVLVREFKKTVVTFAMCVCVCVCSCTVPCAAHDSTANLQVLLTFRLCTLACQKNKFPASPCVTTCTTRHRQRRLSIPSLQSSTTCTSTIHLWLHTVLQWCYSKQAQDKHTRKQQRTSRDELHWQELNEFSLPKNVYIIFTI